MRFIFAFSFATVCLLLTSCMSETYLHVRETPELSVPEQTHRIAIVDRCRFYKQTVVTGNTRWSMVKTEKPVYNYGVLNCMYGIRDNWTENQIADSIFVPYNVELRGMEKAGEIPAALDWETVSKLCTQLHADVLLVLESYKSDYSIVYPARSHTTSFNINDPQPEPLSPQYAHFDISSVWRMYDPRSKTILSELHQSNTVNISPQPDEYGNYFPSEQDMREQVGESAGKQTAMLVFSQWKAVTRTYYTRGSKTIRKGAKLAGDGNWEAAASEWRYSTERKRKRAAAKACLNMAIASEKQGRPDLAAEWARKSQSKGNKAAADYLAQLQRIEEVGK